MKSVSLFLFENSEKLTQERMQKGTVFATWHACFRELFPDYRAYYFLISSISFMSIFHRFSQSYTHLSLQDRYAENSDWSSITDSNYDFTVDSFHPLEDNSSRYHSHSETTAAATSATAEDQIFGRSKEIMILQQEFYSLQHQSQTTLEQQDTKSKF
jgi:hypothetical protein